MCFLLHTHRGYANMPSVPGMNRGVEISVITYPALGGGEVSVGLVNSVAPSAVRRTLYYSPRARRVGSYRLLHQGESKRNRQKML